MNCGGQNGENIAHLTVYCTTMTTHREIGCFGSSVGLVSEKKKEEKNEPGLG